MSVHDNPDNKKYRRWKTYGIGVSAVAGIVGAKTKVIRGLFEDVIEMNRASVDTDFDCNDEYFLGFRLPCGDGTGPYDADADSVSFDVSEFASDIGVGLVSGLVAWTLISLYEHRNAPPAVRV